MPRKSAAKRLQSTTPLLLVAIPSPQTDRKAALLESSGFTVTRADNICLAELFAAQQYFDAAVYDDSIHPQEQISLARIMRIRWPWMRLVSMAQFPPFTDPDLFDSCVTSEATLPSVLNQILVS